MRRLAPPLHIFSDVFDVCTGSIGNGLKIQDFQLIRATIIADGFQYSTLANTSSLYTLAPNPNPDDTVIYGNITKGDLRGLYTGQLRPRKKPGRTIYDQLISLAPLGRCPFCGFGQSRSLDHYLPHSFHPIYSVLPQNLVPCCGDCNGIKNNNVAVIEDEQTIHPYYDQAIFFSEQWLFAQVVPGNDISITYYVAPPNHWTDTNKNRVKHHFETYELDTRFSIEAANELVSLISSLKLLSTPIPADSQIVEVELRREFTNESLLHINSWKTAMYQALMTNAWFCGGGYM